MPPDGVMSIERRFEHNESRINKVEENVTLLRIDVAKQQLKLAIMVGIANFLAFGIIEILFKH